MSELVQYIVVRRDLEMSHGKMAAQVAHASLLAYSEAHCDDVRSWVNGSMAKVILGVKNNNEIQKLMQKLIDNDIDFHAVIDECRTELEKEGPTGTLTCIGIGPIDKDIIKPMIKRVRLY